MPDKSIERLLYLVSPIGLLAASAEFGRLKLDIWRVLEDEVMRARAEAEK